MEGDAIRAPRKTQAAPSSSFAPIRGTRRLADEARRKWGNGRARGEHRPDWGRSSKTCLDHRNSPTLLIYLIDARQIAWPALALGALFFPPWSPLLASAVDAPPGCGTGVHVPHSASPLLLSTRPSVWNAPFAMADAETKAHARRMKSKNRKEQEGEKKRNRECSKVNQVVPG